MAWYEHQPIRWLLETLTARQITGLILGIILIGLYIGSYYVYLDTIQSMRNNSEYFWIVWMIIITFIVFFIALIPISHGAGFLFG